MNNRELFVQRWAGCTACDLCKGRLNLVLGRGPVPCDVLFVGEAPGVSEDACGIPFAPGAPAGALLGRIARQAVPPALRLAYTNLVCCIPLGEDGKKTSAPDDEFIRACAPRLEQFIAEVAKPRLLVAVGKLAKDYLDQGYRHSVIVPEGQEQVHIDHPARMLRLPIAGRDLLTRRAVVTLKAAVRRVFAETSGLEREVGDRLY